MTRLVFEHAAPVAASAPTRMDVACFVGFVRERFVRARGEPEPRIPVPAEIERWLRERGWWSGGAYGRASETSLEDVPVPIDEWDTFDALFDWDARALGAGAATAGTYLGAAVRSFFAQGGRRCYVVRVGDPWPVSSARGPRDLRVKRMAALLPAFPDAAIDSAPTDQGTWCGVGHLFGLPDVTLLCLPDLADIVAVDPAQPAPADEPPQGEEHFAECVADPADEATAANADEIAPRYRAPRADGESYDEWARALQRVTVFLARLRKAQLGDAQLIAAVPIPQAGTRGEAGLPDDALRRYVELDENGRPRDADVWFGSSFIQLAYPWVRTPGSARLPERLESPDAVLTGVIARNALLRGAFRTAAGLHLADVSDVAPPLRRDQLAIASYRGGSVTRRDGRAVRERPKPSFVERVSVLGWSPSGPRVLSDVTASPDESYRPAAVHRLVSIIARAARRVGEGVTFEASGEPLWARVREELGAVLFGLLEAGALRGRSAADAFQVRCDRTTMTQSDIDNGRVIAQVQFAAAAPVELIRITLAMSGGGQLTLVAASSARQEAA